MKEYREILKVENPDQEVKKIMSRLDGNQSVDN